MGIIRRCADSGLLAKGEEAGEDNMISGVSGECLRVCGEYSKPQGKEPSEGLGKGSADTADIAKSAPVHDGEGLGKGFEVKSADESERTLEAGVYSTTSTREAAKLTDLRTPELDDACVCGVKLKKFVGFSISAATPRYAVEFFR